MAFVYWIHHVDHTDVFTGGYVGYTSKTVEQRWKGHFKESRRSRCLNYPVYNAIRKCGKDVIITTLIEGSEDYCSEFETKLRPQVKIGWNLHVGGNKGFRGSTHSDEAKAKISSKGKGRALTDYQRESIRKANIGRKQTDAAKKKMSEARLGVPRSPENVAKQKETLKNKPWLSHRTIKETWIAAEHLYDIFKSDVTMSAKTLGRLANTTEHRMKTILDRFRNGWVPTDCLFWQEFVKEYKETQDVTQTTPSP